MGVMFPMDRGGDVASPWAEIGGVNCFPSVTNPPFGAIIGHKEERVDPRSLDRTLHRIAPFPYYLARDRVWGHL